MRSVSALWTSDEIAAATAGTASEPFNPNQWLAEAVSPYQWISTPKNTQWQLDGYALCAS